MKYGQRLIDTITGAVKNSAVHAYWSVRESSRFDDIQHCEVKFTDCNRAEYRIVIIGMMDGGTAQVDLLLKRHEEQEKWLCGYDCATRDGLLVWLGYALEKAYRYADEEV